MKKCRRRHYPVLGPITKAQTHISSEGNMPKAPKNKLEEEIWSPIDSLLHEAVKQKGN